MLTAQYVRFKHLNRKVVICSTGSYGRQTINNKNKSQPTPECSRLWVLGAGRTGGGLL